MKKIAISIITLLLVILIPCDYASGDGITEKSVKVVRVCSNQAAKVTDDPVNITRYAVKGYEVPWGNIEISEDDFKLMCHTVYKEAGNQSIEAQILVARVILFRVISTQFPNNVHDVIYQENGKQFNVVTILGFPESCPYTELTELAVYTAIATEPTEPRNVFFFRSQYYFDNLEKYDSIGDMYFSYGKED